MGKGWARLIWAAVAIGILALSIREASADDLQAVRVDLERALPGKTLEPFFAGHPLVFRGTPPRATAIYQDTVNGVVLIASTNAVGTGVVVTSQGDIITNDHVVQAAHVAQGAHWVAVWFKPREGQRLAKGDFLIGKVLRRNAQRDLAHIRLPQGLPPQATVVPMAPGVPEIGEAVYTIGHPKTYLWSFGQGLVAQIHPDHHWQYDDGIPRSGTAIQTQAPLNAGSSGSPLLNKSGAIVGIVVGAPQEVQGIHFAVSAQHVRELLPR